MKKSAIISMPDYFDRYINLTDDVDFIQALTIGLEELENIPLAQWKALGDRVYAPGKWTLKDILQHCIDTERIFNYRALAFARGDKQVMLLFEEDDYAKEANTTHRSLEEIIEEAIIVRKSSIALFSSFTEEQLQRTGSGMNGLSYSVLSLGFMIPGHQRWHFKVIDERYLSLID